MKNQKVSKYRITGSRPIGGTIRAGGNKNAALPALAACLLTDDEVILDEIPEIQDVRVMIDIITSLGGVVRKLRPHKYSIRVQSVATHEIASEQAEAIRASILFVGPLLARTGKVILPPPGGDVIGRRRLDTHFLAFSALGAQVEADGIFEITATKLKGADIFLDEASVTATENTIMAAVLAQGKTILTNAASEPHIQDLCNLLNSMGAKITGIGSNILYIDGVKKLHGSEFSIGSDYMEVGSFIGLAAITRAELVIENACPAHLRMMEIAYARMGISWEVDKNSIYVSDKQKLEVVPELDGMIPKIDDAPWPGFPADLTSIMTVVATQITGTILIHEKLFESRMFFVDKLISMGARIILCDPHRAVVSGPAKLQASHLVSPDVRAGMALVLAALCANGKSVIDNVYQIERGYENLIERLKGIGAEISKE